MTKNRYITVTVTLLLVISVLLNMFILQSCKKKTDTDKEQTVETNEIADTVDTSERETAKDTETEEEKETEPLYDPKPEYTETPYPSGLTVEEKIAGYEAFEITPGEYGVDIYGFVTEKESSLPSEFAVTFTHIPDFAVVVKAELDESGSRDFWMEELYYKNTEIVLGDKRYSVGVYSRIEYAENIVAVGFAGYHGRYCLLSQNTYGFFGYKTEPPIDNPLVTYPRYLFYEENGELKYSASYLKDGVYAGMTQSAGELAFLISKRSDLDLYFNYWGSVDYSEGKFTLTQEGGRTIGQKYEGYEQKDYELSFIGDTHNADIYKLYPTFEQYITAKEQGLLPDDHYYKNSSYYREE